MATTKLQITSVVQVGTTKLSGEPKSNLFVKIRTSKTQPAGDAVGGIAPYYVGFDIVEEVEGQADIKHKTFFPQQALCQVELNVDAITASYQALKTVLEAADNTLEIVEITV